MADFVVAPMTDEQRKSVALEYLLRLDTGRDFLALFGDHAHVYFPKWGVARGREEFTRMFGDLALILKTIRHDTAHFNYVIQGDMVVVEGTTSGTTTDGGEWRAGVTHGGYFCDVFEIRNHKIQRVYIYLDPDYAGRDTDRYPWLRPAGEPTPPKAAGKSRTRKRDGK